MGNCVVVTYSCLNVVNEFICPCIDSDISKSNVQLDQHCLCLNVLLVVMFSSSLLSACREKLKFHTVEISVLELH